MQEAQNEEKKFSREFTRILTNKNFDGMTGWAGNGKNQRKIFLSTDFSEKHR